MPAPDHVPASGPDAPGPHGFTTTQWSVVLAAGGGSSPDAAAALERLCRTYWRPLFAYLRRCGHPIEDAEDLTQGFLAHLLERNALARLRPDKGRFRSFLLAGLKNFLADAQDRARARKRGGGLVFIPLDDVSAESAYAAEQRHELTPEQIFDRRWAGGLIGTVLRRLREELAAAGKQDLFEGLQPFLVGEFDGHSYAAVAGRLGLTEAAAKMTVTRMRRRYRELLRAEVANTLTDPRDVDEELKQLFAALQ